MSEEPVQLRRLPIAARFTDFSGKQVFEKIGECTFIRRRVRRHIIQCVHSPFKKLPGPVCAAFFCAIGDVVYREGSLRVFPLLEKETA